MSKSNENFSDKFKKWHKGLKDIDANLLSSDRKAAWYRSKGIEKFAKKRSKRYGERKKFIEGADDFIKKGFSGKLGYKKYKMEKSSILKYIIVFGVIIWSGIQVFTEEDAINYSRIIVGFVLSLFPLKVLGSPLFAMRYILNDLLDRHNHYGFIYYFSKISGSGIYGIIKSLDSTTGVIAWPISKILLYIPIFIISLVQYAIPLVLGIALGLITAIITLLTSILLIPPLTPIGAALDEGLVVVDEGVETIGDWIDMFFGSIIKKGWRMLNKYIPFQKVIKYYVIGFLLYDWFYPLLMKIYVTFALIIIIHYVLNIILYFIFKLMDKIQNRLLIDISYVIIMGGYYFIQFYFIKSFVLDSKDPYWTLRDLLQLDPGTDNINFYGKINELFSGECSQGSTCTTNRMRTLYTVIGIIISYLLMLLTPGENKSNKEDDD